MYTATKLIFLCLFIFMAGFTQVEFKSMKVDDGIVYSDVDPSLHGIKCNCGYCLEGWNDSINEHREDYYMEIAGIDSALKLGQELTVMSIDTLEGLTCVTLK